MRRRFWAGVVDTFCEVWFVKWFFVVQMLQSVAF
jgi:hypothetical protein